MPPASTDSKAKNWTSKISRSGYFFAALFLHLIVFVMVATWVIFPAFNPPVDTFDKTYLPPPSAPPPPPPVQQTVQVPTHAVAPPTTVISSANSTATFSVPLPDFTTQTTSQDPAAQKMTQKPVTTSNNLPSRLAAISKTVQGWGRDSNDIRQSNGDPRNIKAKFPLFLASYANGDWACNTILDSSHTKIVGGSLMNFVEKMNQWSHNNITGEVIPTPLNIGGPDLLDKKPPFIFFTGHKDFVLTQTEIDNLRNYLQVGGAIWGDNSLAGRGSRFDVAFRREMKRVVPDEDKKFEVVAMTDPLFTKSWFPITKLAEGMNYYSEPIEHLDIDGKLAILYTPNDYGDLFSMHILPGDTEIDHSHPAKFPLITNEYMWKRRNIFFRNYTLDSSIQAQQLAMNIIGYLLVRFDNDLLLAPQ